MLRLIQHIYILPLFASMLFSLKAFRLNWPAPYKTFASLLILITAVETMAILWKYWLFDRIGAGHFSNSNIWLYNCFIIPQYLLYLYVYYQVATTTLRKKIILGVGVLFTVITITDILFFQSLDTVSSFAIIAASLTVIFLTTSYFEQLRKQEAVIPLTAHPMAWISLGAFIFHAANLPYIISLNYLIHNNIPLAVALFYIYMGLNCIMYTLYSIAFLCRYPLHK